MRRLACAAAMACASAGQAGDLSPNAVAVFGGEMLDNSFEDVFINQPDLEFEDSFLAGVALSRRLAEPVPGLTLEVEAQLVRHFGAQTHWEVNAPIGFARWSRFPWSDSVATSAAFGLGLSMASETPRLEIENEGESQAVMVYWAAEIELGAPGSDWSVFGRLHHRSTGFGLFGEDGGANALAIGLRRRF